MDTGMRTIEKKRKQEHVCLILTVVVGAAVVCPCAPCSKYDGKN